MSVTETVVVSKMEEPATLAIRKASHAPVSEKLLMWAAVVGHSLNCLYFASCALKQEWSPLTLFFGLLFGTLATDGMSTLTHFALDNYGTEQTPIVGMPIFYFREHHHHPLKMLRRDHIENVWTENIFASFVMYLFYFLIGSDSPTVLLALAVLGFWGGQITAIHKASHTAKPNAFYKALQNLGLIISRDYHAKHHKNFNSHHSLCCGIVDAIFAKFYVLQTMESIIYLLTGAVAVHTTFGLVEPARPTFAGRVQHLKWLIWYQIFDWITASNSLELRFMNWGYSGPVKHQPLPNADKVLSGESRQHQIDSASLQLYLHLANGPNVSLRDKDVVEVSSGKGGGLSCLAASEIPRSCTGIDLCEANITFCTDRYSTIPRLSFRNGDAMSDLRIQADIIFNVEASHCYPSRETFFQNCHNSLRSGGLLLFVDFMHKNDVSLCRKYLTTGGMFTIEKDEDISENVLQAMAETDDAKRSLIAEFTRPWLAPLVHRFSATKNSTMWRDLSGKEWVYHLFQARRS